MFLLMGVSCAMEKPPVELRLDSPPSPEAIPLSDEEKATLEKHPEVREFVRAWSNREFHVRYEGEEIVFPAERAYARVKQGQVVGVSLFSPKITETETHHLITTALRAWKASPEAVVKFETWWRGDRGSIVEMQIGDDEREVSVGVCPSFNEEKPLIFKCEGWWKLQTSFAADAPADGK